MYIVHDVVVVVVDDLELLQTRDEKTDLPNVKGEVKANTIFDLTFDACQKCSKSNFSSRERWSRAGQLKLELLIIRSCLN